MKFILGPGILAGLTLVCALSAVGQTPNATANNAASATAEKAPLSSKYNYAFIAQGYVWSNKPLNTTASKICQTMKDHAFSETPYAISGDHDWNECLSTQVQSIGYLRWLQNAGFKATKKNRKSAQAYLQKTYTMGPWGSYSFAELVQAAQATSGPIHP